MNRRKFVKTVGLGAVLLAKVKLLHACNTRVPKWAFVRSGIPLHLAHTLRTKQSFGSSQQRIKTKHLIVGGGVSGLSAGYHLQQAGEVDFRIIEMESQLGGNAQYGETKTGKFPQGAHYLPIQNNNNTPLLDFLHKIGVISHFSHDGIPYYNEEYLCHDPEDRLFINGKWQAGIVEGLLQVYPDDKPVWDRFFEQMEGFKHLLGSDGKPFFAIPERFASQDRSYDYLDRQSFATYLTDNKLRCRSLNWYLDYCCRDDYGQDTTKVSAFAGIHYFAARRAESKNADPNGLLTWPEGNGFLVDRMISSYRDKTITNTIVRSIEKTEYQTYLVHSWNWKTNTIQTFETVNLLLAIPIHIRKHLLANILERDWLAPTHQPWYVVTVELTPFADFSGAPVAWDNVLFEHPTLGYIHNLNQHLKKPNGNTLLTFYQPLDQSDARTVREKYAQQSDEELKSELVAQLRSIYRDIEEHILYMEVRIWGHGMASPGIDYLKNPKRSKQSEATDNIYFAHTDDCGFSLFEEAFDLGFQRATQLIQNQRNVDI